MAHRCWALDEIVRVIAANLVLDKANASAVSLANCSKSLEEPALSEVWRSLSSLAPLVKSFPPEVWEIREEKLASTAMDLEDVLCGSDQPLIVFQEGSATRGMDAISAAVRIKGPTPGSFLPGCSNLTGRTPPPSTVLSPQPTPSQSRVVELG
jgi:hypothetical protein